MHDTALPSHVIPKEYPPIVSEAMAAEMVSMSIDWLKLRRYMGDGPPFIRLGRRIRYDRDKLLTWFAAREVARS